MLKNSTDRETGAPAKKQVVRSTRGIITKPILSLKILQTDTQIGAPVEVPPVLRNRSYRIEGILSKW